MEAALVTPLIFLILFGTIEFGMVFKDYLAVTSSVRAGARIASAEPRQADFAQDAANDVAREASALDMSGVQALWVYKALPNGKPQSGTFDSCTDACVTFKWEAGAFTKQSDTWPYTAQNACQGDAARDSVGVYLKIKHDALTGFVFDSLTLSDHTVMSLEPMSSLSVCK